MAILKPAILISVVGLFSLRASIKRANTVPPNSPEPKRDTTAAGPDGDGRPAGRQQLRARSSDDTRERQSQLH